jgi:hypothetical protein
MQGCWLHSILLSPFFWSQPTPISASEEKKVIIGANKKNLVLIIKYYG